MQIILILLISLSCLAADIVQWEKPGQMRLVYREETGEKVWQYWDKEKGIWIDEAK